MEILIWTLYFVTPKYSDYTQYYMMLLELFEHILTNTWLLQHDWSRSKFLLAWSCDWTIILPLRKNLSTLHFNSVNFWNSMSCLVLAIELTDKNIIKELGLFIDGSVQGFSFCPPKAFKPNKQTTWNTSHLHGIARSSGKLEYDKLFIVSYDIKKHECRMFAKGLEKCRLLTRLLGQNVENLDDYGCSKSQDLFKTGNSWICSSYLFRHKTRLHCAERKAKVYGEWAMQHL